MRRIIILGLMLGMSLVLIGQTMELSGVDTVTVGSKMIYEVVPDAVIAATPSMNPSHFDWYFTNASNVVISSGIVLDETPDGTTGFYSESTINVAFDAGTYLAGTTIKVKTSEVSQPKFGAGCSGNEEEIDIFFVDKPTVEIVGTSGGGCSATAVDIPLNVTGYGPFDITFTVERNQSGSTIAFTETIGSVSNKAGSVHSLVLTVNTTKHLIGTTGRFDIVITNIVDRFSGKSSTAITGSVSSPNYTIGINPTPVTQPIQHIRNL
jgi:hypothetical protein